MSALPKSRLAGYRRLWAAPLLLGFMTLVGLVSALLADGLWDGLSWLGLGLPALACFWYWLRPASS